MFGESRPFSAVVKEGRILHTGQIQSSSKIQMKIKLLNRFENGFTIFVIIRIKK
jgi:hypothetical protein